MNQVQIHPTKYPDLNFNDLLEMGLSVDSLLHYLGESMLNTPAEHSLTALLCKLATMDSAKQDGSLLRVKVWVEKEVALGTLCESEIRTILQAATHSINSNGVKVQASISWSVCPHIWNGIMSSKVRRADDLENSTITCLLVAAARSPDLDTGLSMGTEIILNRAKLDSNMITSNAFKFLRHIVGNRQAVPKVDFRRKRYVGRLTQAIRLLESLPKENANEVIVYVLSALSREKNASSGLSYDKRHIWLWEWMVALSESNLLINAKQDERLKNAWTVLEGRFLPLGQEYLALYLRSSSDTEICSFLLKNLLVRWELSRLAKASSSPRDLGETLLEEALRLLQPPIASQSLKQVTASAEASPQAYSTCPYTNLVVHISKNANHLLHPLIHILLPLLRRLEKTEAILLITHRLGRRNTHIPLGLLFTEISYHTDNDPLFALTLLTTDRRPQMTQCPSLQRALAHCEDIPTVTLLRLFRLFTRAYKVEPNHRDTTCPLDHQTSSLLGHIAKHIARSYSLSSRQVFRRVRRILMLFRTQPEFLQPQMAVALTMAGIVRPLEAGQKVPNWQRQWIGQWVVGLEGEDAWQQVQKDIGRWWYAIERRKEREGKVWEIGEGWVEPERQGRWQRVRLDESPTYGEAGAED